MHILFLILKHDHKKMNIEYGMSYLYVNCVSRIKQIIQHLSGGHNFGIKGWSGDLKTPKIRPLYRSSGSGLSDKPEEKKGLFYTSF